MTIRRTIAHLSHWRAQQSYSLTSFYTADSGQYRPITWGEGYERSTRLAMGLLELGARKGDRLAIVSETRYEWSQFDGAILSFGGIVVGIYPTSTAEQVGYILRHSGSRIAILEDQTQLDKLEGLDLPDLQQVVLIDSKSVPPGKWLSMNQLAEKGQALLEENPDLPGECRDSVQPEDTAAIVYTSGTTGPPKGVVLRHENLVDVAQSVNEFIDLTSEDVALAFLPMAHVLQRVNTYIGMSIGLTGYYVRDISKLVEVCQEANPTVVSGVPRIFEKMHAKVMSGIEQAPPRRQRMLKNALAAGRQRARLIGEGHPIPLLLRVKIAVYDRLVFSKLRTALFGQRIRYLNSGAAPLGMGQLEFFFAIGLPLFEGYGLTETSSPITLNGFAKYRVGTVGPALPRAEVKIGEDGEILLKGPGVFREYYKDAEATRDAFTEDGWFMSGDIGELDEAGFLRVTDRKKNLIITSGGKNIAPANVENHMMRDPYISQVMAYGDRQKYLVALITLDEEAIKEWAEQHGKGGLTYAELTQDDEVQQLVDNAVERGNQALAPFEQIRYFRILPEELSVESGLITPTLKLKRGVVEEKYGHLLQEMYA